MKATVVCAVLLLAGMIPASATDVYPDSVLCEAYGTVQYKGKAPSIVDFVTCLQDPEEHPEFFGDFYDAWQCHLRGRSPGIHERLTVDRRHGYVFYECRYPDDEHDERGCMEYCFWNCADGKHKIVAQSVYFLYDGEASPGQYDGVQFFLYDNDTHVMKHLLPMLNGEALTWIAKLGFRTNPNNRMFAEVDDIIAWTRYNGLRFIQCACRFTDEKFVEETGGTKRQEIKELIRELKKTNPNIEKSIFNSLHRVHLDTFAGFKTKGKEYSFLDRY